MKQHYIRTAIIIDLLILAIFLIGIGSYTYILANDEMNSHMDQVRLSNYNHYPAADARYSDADLIKYSYDFWEFYITYKYRETGFYGFLMLEDGTVFDTSSDYCWVWLAEDNYFTNDEMRIFFVDDESFDEVGHLYDPSFDGECDDLFIHGGNMVHGIHTYKLGDIDYHCGDMVPVSTWKGDTYLYGTVVKTSKNSHDAKLNQEAKALSNKLLEQVRSDGSDELTKKSIWTSYYVHTAVTQRGVFCTVHVYHPVETVIILNKGTYIALTVAFLLIEVIISFAISKLYKSNMEFEMKSRRLTRGVAHELKTPLAVTKAYMENWDYIDEKDREEYAKKINREVDDMTVLINALLEMDKIDSGRLKLNIEEIDISALLWSVYNHVRPLAMERNLNVIMPDSEEIMIKADLKFMKIALGNYLTNMVKYADKKAEVQIINEERSVWIKFRNDSTNDKKNNTDKLNSNGMGVEINENIMKLHGFKYGASMGNTETVFWFEAPKA